MSYCQCRLKSVFSSIFNKFGFKNVALFVDRSDLFSLTMGKNLEYGLNEEGVLKFHKEFDGNDLLRDSRNNTDEWNNVVKSLLQDSAMYSRVVILAVRGKLVRKFMLAAHQLGMTRGEWVFFDIEIFQVSELSSFRPLMAHFDG